MYIKVQGTLINLDNVISINKINITTKYYGIRFSGEKEVQQFSYETEKERDIVFDEIIKCIDNTMYFFDMDDLKGFW